MCNIERLYSDVDIPNDKRIIEREVGRIVYDEACQVDLAAEQLHHRVEQ